MAHRGLGCHVCHFAKNVAKINWAAHCYACHAIDDVHDGAFRAEIRTLPRNRLIQAGEQANSVTAHLYVILHFAMFFLMAIFQR